MTSHVVHPGEYEVPGIFLIGREELIELDTLIDESQKEIDAYVSRRLTQQTGRELKERDQDPDTHRKQVREQLKERHPFNKHEQQVSVVCRSKNTLKGKRFCDILDNPELGRESPTHATITLQNADAGLTVKVLSSYFRDSIEVSVTPNKPFAQKIGRRFRDWAESKRQVAWWRKLAFPAGTAGIVLLYICMTLIPYGLFTFTQSSEKSSAIERAYALLDDGIDTSEESEAIEILLRLQTGDFKQGIAVSVKPWYVSLLVVGAGLFTFGYMRPKSTVGIGGSASRMQFYVFLIRQIRISVGIWIVAVITSAIGSAVYDVITRLGHDR